MRWIPQIAKIDDQRPVGADHDAAVGRAIMPGDSMRNTRNVPRRSWRRIAAGDGNQHWAPTARRPESSPAQRCDPLINTSMKEFPGAFRYLARNPGQLAVGRVARACTRATSPPTTSKAATTSGCPTPRNPGSDQQGCGIITRLLQNTA
jgi:hypothetical protein